MSSLVTNTVEKVFNKVLDSEADEMVEVARYERSADRQDYRSGSYTRKPRPKRAKLRRTYSSFGNRDFTLPL